MGIIFFWAILWEKFLSSTVGLLVLVCGCVGQVVVVSSEFMVLSSAFLVDRVFVCCWVGCAAGRLATESGYVWCCVLVAGLVLVLCSGGCVVLILSLELLLSFFVLFRFFLFFLLTCVFFSVGRCVCFGMGLVPSPLSSLLSCIELTFGALIQFSFRPKKMLKLVHLICLT